MSRVWFAWLLGGLLLVPGCAGMSSEPPLTLEDRTRAIKSLEQARARITRGNLVIAKGYLHDGMTLATRGKWLDLVADGHFMLGEIWEREGNLNGAIAAYGSALAASRQIQDRARGVKALNALGNLFLDVGVYDRALEASQEALKLSTAAGDIRSKGTALNNIGEVYRFRGQHLAALEAYREALALAKEAGNTRDAAMILTNMGVVTRSAGKMDEAQRFLNEALQLGNTMPDPRIVMDAMNHLASIHNDQKQYAQAIPYAKGAEQIGRQEKFLRPLAQANLNLGIAEWQSGNQEHGRQRLTEALRLAAQVNDRYLVAFTKLTLGKLVLETGDQSTARVALEDSLRLFLKEFVFRNSENLCKGHRGVDRVS